MKNSIDKVLRPLYEKGILSAIDLHFALFLERLSKRPSPDLGLAAALLSASTREGNVCFDLSHWKEKNLIPSMPEKDLWCRNLRESDIVGAPGEYKPLILDDKGKLYLYRYWEYEATLASLIQERVRHRDESIDRTLLRSRLDQMFPTPTGSSDGIDWQKVAVATPLLQKFTVISGGPGTGKTTTVARILALILVSLGPSIVPEKTRLGLVAPTGKGASRLGEAIKSVKETLPCERRILREIPEQASTIHRLLGAVPGSPYFRFHSENRLPLDALVVDEASMVDMPLMSKLIQALPEQSRLILLGDKDQLASVEAGAMLADICDAGQSLGISREHSKDLQMLTGYEMPSAERNPGVPTIGDGLVILEKSYRFGERSGIAQVSAAVREGNGELALRLLRDGGYADVVWKDIGPHSESGLDLKVKVIQGFKDLLGAEGPEEVFEALGRFRILCAVREGPYGVITLNRMIERILREEHLIKADQEWYRGRPIIIHRNDYHLLLFNGDVGVALPDPASGNELRVFFQGESGILRGFHPMRLPDHETMYALTVHKSQGSEFDHVLFILPEKDTPLLTRELIYTAMTRARKRMEIWGDQSVFRKAVVRRTERTSGLREALLASFHRAPS